MKRCHCPLSLALIFGLDEIDQANLSCLGEKIDGRVGDEFHVLQSGFRADDVFRSLTKLNRMCLISRVGRPSQVYLSQLELCYKISNYTERLLKNDRADEIIALIQMIEGIRAKPQWRQ